MGRSTVGDFDGIVVKGDCWKSEPVGKSGEIFESTHSLKTPIGDGWYKDLTCK